MKNSKLKPHLQEQSPVVPYSAERGDGMRSDSHCTAGCIKSWGERDTAGQEQEGGREDLRGVRGWYNGQCELGGKLESGIKGGALYYGSPEKSWEMSGGTLGWHNKKEAEGRKLCHHPWCSFLDFIL